MMENTPITWEAQEHHHEEKSNDWFWTVGIIAVSAAVIAIILSNLLFGIFILIAAFTLAMHAVKRPRTLKVLVDKRGVTVANVHYPYSALDSFWINENEHPPVLLLKSPRFFLPLIVIRIEEFDIETLRAYLRDMLYEEELHEPLLQKLAEYFGF